VSSPNDARRAGRGLLSIAGAKIYFIVTSYAVQLALPRIFGEPEEFGLYSAAMSGVAIFNNVLVVSTIQSVSKFVSEDEHQASATLRQGLKLQALLGGALACLVFGLAPAVSRLLLDEQLTPLLQVASIAVLAYALYAALVGSLNGRHLFVKQARLDIGFSTFRTAGIVVGAALGFGAIGAVAGFATAAIAILTLASLWVGWGEHGRSIAWKRWLTFLGPIWVYQVFLNGILMIDLQVLKRTAAELALRDGAGVAAAADVANQYVGYYRAAQTFAFVPYQLIIALTFIVFPMISRATSLGDRKLAQQTIRHALRLSLLVLLLFAAPIAGTADGVMRLAYPPDYAQGSDALRVLVFGVVAFAMFVVSATAVSGTGRPSIAAVIGGLALLAVVLAVRALIDQVGLGEHTLRATALGTSLGMVVALLLSALALHLLLGAFVPAMTWLRSAVAGAMGYFVSSWIPHESAPMTLLALSVGFSAAVAALWLTRELKPEDWQVLRSVLGKEAQPERL
jgi:stage V sporulation protein B